MIITKPLKRSFLGRCLVGESEVAIFLVVSTILASSLVIIYFAWVATVDIIYGTAEQRLSRLDKKNDTQGPR